jgi:hypothetical protein
MHIKSFPKYYEMFYILLLSIYYFGGPCCSPLHYLFISQQQLDQMARLQTTRRKRVGVIRELPVDVIAAIAEVGATDRLGLQLLVY